MWTCSRGIRNVFETPSTTTTGAALALADITAFQGTSLLSRSMPKARSATRLRWAAGRAYGAAWRRAEGLLQRSAPRSVRDERRLPRLPAEPYERKYGMRLGPPVDRVYIEGFLERRREDIRGDVLEILDSVYTRRFGGARVQRADVLDASPDAAAATVRGNLETGEGLPREAYDCFICTQTLSLIYDLRSAVANAHALLRPGGVLLVTVPGISQQADPDHEEFPDYWRFTKRSLQRLLAGRLRRGQRRGPGARHGGRAPASFLYGVPTERVDPALLAPARPRLRDGRLRASRARVLRRSRARCRTPRGRRAGRR